MLIMYIFNSAADTTQFTCQKMYNDNDAIQYESNVL